MRKPFFFIALLFSAIWNPILAAQIAIDAQKQDVDSPSFDAVSIRVVEKFHSTQTASGLVTTTAPMNPCGYRTDRVTCQLSLRSLIQEAFQLNKQEMAALPKEDDHLYLVQAVMPSNTEKTIARRMLQSVLKDRFGLKFHREIKQISAYALIQGAHGTNLQPAEDSKHRKLLDSGLTAVGRGATVRMSPGQFSAVAISLDELADDLNIMAGIDRPVINMTGLHGAYKIDLHWTPEEGEQSTVITILDAGFPTAVQKQLGLKLEKRTLPAEVFVIDHIDPIPTEN